MIAAFLPMLMSTTFAAPTPPIAVSALAGETSTFDVTYLGATAGRVKFRLENSGGKTALVDYVASARTDPVFSLFYRVDNEYRSTVDIDHHQSAGFATKIDEKKRRGHTAVRFDDKRNAKSHEEWETESDKPRINDQLISGAATHDPLSAILYLRTQPLKIGDAWKFKVLVGKEILDFHIKVTGEEKLPTKIGDMPAWILTPELVRAGQASEPLSNQIWIGKEGAHPLLKLKAKLKIGSIILYLKDYKPAPAPASSEAP